MEKNFQQTKMQGGCLSAQDVKRALFVLEGKDERVSKKQRQALEAAIRKRMADERAGIPGDSVQGAVMHRRIQELAWYIGDPATGAIGVSPGRVSVDPKIAHCFNSELIHKPEVFAFTKSTPGNPFKCRRIGFPVAMEMCPQKQEQIAKLFKQVPETHVVDLQADFVKTSVDAASRDLIENVSRTEESAKGAGASASSVVLQTKTNGL